ncbi:MAG: carbohydrate binding domain-containing protein [Armatimonadetes bacterium]|nr:carbohydrate binding domain-containing protein [Armatimonadota bacterium]
MRWLVILLLLPALAPGADPTGLLNGSFELDADHDGVPDGWTTSGDNGIKQALRQDKLPDGTFCALLECTAFARSSPASHAMLAQYDTLKLQQGHWYRLRFRVRAEGVAGGSLDVALSNTREWSNIGLQDSAFLTADWTWCETTFRATQTTREGHRLQLWWGSTGKVWFDEMTLDEVEAPKRRFLERLPETAARNRVPNGGFECGAAGWGSVTDLPGWGGNLNRLFGEVVEGGAHAGRRCLKIAVTPQTRLTCWFDYFDLMQQPLVLPLAAHSGWIGVEPGQTCSVSAWVRAAPAGQTVLLRARSSNGGRSEKRFAAVADWTRIELAFKPAADQVYAAVGPDLAADKRDSATLWVDDVMLEAGGSASTWEPRGAVEVAVRVPRDGGLFEPGEPVSVAAVAANHTPQSRSITLRWTATDFHDALVNRGERKVDLPPGVASEVTLPIRAAKRGFYRVSVTAEGAEVTPPLPLRLAVIPFNTRPDTLVGMNHAYPTADLLELSRRIGLGWFRDWSYKWQQVEPEKGRFDFAGPDAQVDRVLAHKLHVLALLPFPGSRWASEAPPAAGQENYQQNMERIAHAPKDPADLAEYVRRTVAHLKGRIDTVEIFNEPIYTEYALSQKFGYKPADYCRLLAVASKAAREANPRVKVIGGIQAPPGHLTREFIAAGGPGSVDAMSFHAYPGRGQPEGMVGPFEELRADLAAAGHAKLPLYFTEGAYYADDDPEYLPYNSSWIQLLPSERVAAAFTLRLTGILCGYGTQRIIWHSGTPGAINEVDPSGIYFEYDGLPRALVPVLATFNELVGPDVTTRGRAKALEGVYAYALESGGKTVVMAWAPGKKVAVPVDRARWRVLDMLGNPVTGALTLNDEPVYLVGSKPGMTVGW